MACWKTNGKVQTGWNDSEECLGILLFLQLRQLHARCLMVARLATVIDPVVSEGDEPDPRVLMRSSMWNIENRLDQAGDAPLQADEWPLSLRR